MSDLRIALVAEGETDWVIINSALQAILPRLANLPKEERIKKKVREYRGHSATIKAAWQNVRQRCSLAEMFHLEITEATQRLTL